MPSVKLSMDRSWIKTLKLPGKQTVASPVLDQCHSRATMSKSSSVSLRNRADTGTTYTATCGLDCVLFVITSFSSLNTRSYCNYTSKLKTNMPAIFANTHVRTFVLIWPAPLTVIGESGIQLSSPESFVAGFPLEGVSF